MERRAHAVVFALRHPAGEDQALGAAAERPVQCPHADLAERRWRRRVSVRSSARPAPTYQSACAPCPPAFRHVFDRMDSVGRPLPAISCAAPKRHADFRAWLNFRRSPCDRLRTPAAIADRAAGRCSATLVGLTMAGLLWLMGLALSAGGIGIVDGVLLVLFAVTLPWSVIGFWNAVIGFFVMRVCARPGRGRHATGREHPRRRADRRLDRDPDLHPQRDAGAGDAQPRAAAGRLAACGAGERFHVYMSERHQRSRRRGRRGSALRGARRRSGAAASASPIAGARRTPASRPATSATSASAGAPTTNSRSRSTPTA